MLRSKIVTFAVPVGEPERCRIQRNAQIVREAEELLAALLVAAQALLPMLPALVHTGVATLAAALLSRQKPAHGAVVQVMNRMLWLVLLVGGVDVCIAIHLL